MKWRTCHSGVCAVFTLTIVCAAVGSAQITNVSLDLRNNFSWHRTRQMQGDLNLQGYGQYYVLAMNGFAVDPRLAQFSLQTSFNDFSSTSTSILVKQSLRSRNVGYYNVSATVLPNNGYALTLYASRSDAINTGSVELLAQNNPATQTTNEVETMGLRWNIVKNTYTPQIEVILERNKNRGSSGFFPVNQTNDVLSLGLSNANEGATSQYSFLYRGLRFKDEVYGIKRSNHEFQFYGNSKVSDQLDVSTNSTYAVQNQGTSRNSEVVGAYRQTADVQHRLRFQNAENRFAGFTTNKNVTNTLAHETSVMFSSRVRGTFGALYSLQQNKYGTYQSHTDRAQTQAALGYNDRFPFADVTGNVSVNAGFERYASQGKKFVQQTQFSAGGTSTTLRRVQLTLQEDFGFSTTYYFGDIVTNTVRVGVTSNVVPRSVVGIDLSRGDTRYLDFTIVAPRSVTSIGASVSTQVTMTTTAQVQHTRSWTRSWYLEQSARTSIAVFEAGFFRNLTFQVRGDRDYNSFTRLRTTRIKASADYRFYSFTLSARYNLYAVAGIQTQGILFEVRRPFAFDFR